MYCSFACDCVRLSHGVGLECTHNMLKEILIVYHHAHMFICIDSFSTVFDDVHAKPSSREIAGLISLIEYYLSFQLQAIRIG